MTDNLQRIGLRAFGGLGINLGVFEEGLANAKQESTALAESFVGIDKIFNKLGDKDLSSLIETDVNLAPQIVAAAEAYVLTTNEADRYKKLVKDINALESEREKNQTRLAQLSEKIGPLTSEEVEEYEKLEEL